MPTGCFGRGAGAENLPPAGPKSAVTGGNRDAGARGRAGLRGEEPKDRKRGGTRIAFLPGLCELRQDYTQPWASMASATFRKPAMLAPTT